ncbi:hypothetical protein [Aurantiacibacter flavus]|uniref:Uncharacterized protein n=1 Tax=Aurantiacibacter flavus TaxID=3145232 RepID=A0ABV0D2Q4_9SPHN
MRDAVRAQQRIDVGRDPANIGELGAGSFRPATLAENPAGFLFRHIKLAQLLDRDRLAGAVSIFEYSEALLRSTLSEQVNELRVTLA